MGLTKPRASQIFDIDYKQATRVITVSNVTLSGGAPSVVDGVSLVVDDRVLVTGQSSGSQNGIYRVSVLGVGSDGTWVRTSDGNEDGEIQAGMIIMVTEGTTYADTQWKLTTDNPIEIGTTALTFEQSSAYSFGTVAVSGQASVVADSVGDTLTIAAGDNISITTDAGTDTLTIGVTGISLNSIANGTSNVDIASSGGNVTIGIASSEIGKFSSSGLDVTGRMSATGNVTGGNISTAGKLTVTGTVDGDLVPSVPNIYSLGNSTNRWSNLYLTGNTIYLGNSIITETENGDIVIDNSGSFAVPVGTTAQRSEVQGAIRYNTTVGVFETYDGAGWNSLAYGTITDFPLDDYGDLTGVTTDAFGVSLASTFDCNNEGALSYTNLGAGEAYVGA